MQTVITLCIYILLACGLVSCRSCNDGFFWDESKGCVKCPDNCQFCESNEYCLSCKNGYWGNACEHSCSACKADTSCDKTNGFCLESCKDGYTGVLCDSNCSERCLSCNRTNAQICVGCAHGWYPPVSCNKSCPDGCLDRSCSAKDLCTNGCYNGFYGQLCKLKCSGNCRENLCYQDNGTCVHGCEGQFTGTKCDTPKKTENSATVVAVVVLVLVLISGVVITVVIVVRRNHRRASKSQKSEEAQEMLPPDVERSNESTNTGPGSVRKEKTEDSSQTQVAARNTVLKRLCFCFKEQEAEKPKNDTDTTSVFSETQLSRSKEVPSVPAQKTKEQKLQELIDRIKSKKVEDLEAEFCLLPIGLEKSHTKSQEKNNETNMEKEGVFPYDENIVTVHGKDGEELYVNASFIEGKGGNAYIASRGPRKKDGPRRMWKLLWENDCKTVVMLNTFKKGEKKNNLLLSFGEKKNYWPSKKTSYDKMSVSRGDKQKKELENEDCNIRLFKLEEGEETKFVKQLQYTGWTEKEIPDKHKLLAFIKRVRDAHLKGNGPIVVHGRRGVGRTGTFIALYMLMKEVDDLLNSDEDNAIDVFHCVKNLRKQRTLMVENSKQYKFLHEALQHYAEELLKNERNKNTETPKQKDKRNTARPNEKEERNTEKSKEKDARNTETSSEKDARNTETSKEKDEGNTERAKEDRRNTETPKKKDEGNTDIAKEKDKRNREIPKENNEGNRERAKEKDERNSETANDKDEGNTERVQEKDEGNKKTQHENKATQKEKDKRNTKSRMKTNRF